MAAHAAALNPSNGRGRPDWLPHDVEAERKALGCCILLPELIGTLNLTEDDFYSEAHRQVWRALTSLRAEGAIVDSLRLRERLADLGRLEAIGGDDFLLSLTDTVPVPDPPTDRLKRLARMRALAQHSRRLDSAVRSENFEAARAAASAISELDSDPARRAKQVPSLAERAIAYRPPSCRLETGFPTLDEATRGGIPPDCVVVLVGAPGASKTSLAVSLGFGWALAGCHVTFIAGDEAWKGIMVRVGQLAGLERAALEGHSRQAREELARFLSERAPSLLVVDPQEDAVTLEDVEQISMSLGMGAARVIIVDSLQTVACAATSGSETPRERMDAVMNVCKAVAKRGALVIAISEMSRGGYRTGDRRSDVATLASAKESSSIEYGAALVLGLRSVKGEEGQVDVDVAKNRLGGAKPECRLQHDRESARFSEIQMPEQGVREETNAEARLAAAKDRVRTVVRERAGLASQRDILAHCNGGRTANHDAVREMVRTGELVLVAGSFRLQTIPKGGQQ